MHAIRKNLQGAVLCGILDEQFQDWRRSLLADFWRPDGAQRRIRTTDTRIFNPLLYQLSYLGIRQGRLGGIPCKGRRWCSARKRVGYTTSFAPVQREAARFRD
jgi:hypothetical protein